MVPMQALVVEDVQTAYTYLQEVAPAVHRVIAQAVFSIAQMEARDWLPAIALLQMRVQIAPLMRIALGMASVSIQFDCEYLLPM